MTCLVGVIHEGEAYIGTDGYATTEDCEIKPIICRKIFRAGDYLVAFAGHIRTGQLLYPESGFKFPDDIYQIPNSMYIWLREFEAIGKDDSQMGMIASNFLIAKKNKLYEIYMDMQISEVDPKIGFTAMGAGSPFALGSLYTMQKKKLDRKSPKMVIKTALDAAAKFIKNCGPPYNIYSYSEAMKKLKSNQYDPPENEEQE